MKPKLVAMSGPLGGQVVSLSREQLSVGRGASSDLRLGDPLVSRRHCLVTTQAGSCALRDLDSHNGTFVNEVPVKERILEHGDQIRLGSSVFLYLTQEEDAVAGGPTSVLLDEGSIDAQSTVELSWEDAFYLKTEKVLASLSTAGLMARDLHALLKVSTSVNAVRGVQELESRLLELIFEAIPAERGAILLLSEAKGEILSYGRERGSSREIAVRVSRTIVQQVLRDGVSVLCGDLLQSEEYRAAESLAALRIQSVLCVPLRVADKMLGTIYLDARSSACRFSEDHLQLLTAIAGIAAVALENARHLEWLQEERRRLQADLNVEHSMIGESPRMREVYQFIARVAPAGSTVLIRGETGTGKEMAACAIHKNSARADKPFLAINCAALSEALLESELFGHEKGAFTGAIAQKKGKLEIADGGTVFLDEVGELAPSLQAKLLRVLQEREFDRVGGTRPLKVDIRLIAATNKALEDAVKQGSFRQDLYYRLNVLSVTLPPHRERREDIPLLASYFAAKYSRKCRRQVSGIAPEARACLLEYDWPGNIRELENAIERAVVLGSTDIILPEDLPETVLESAVPKSSSGANLHEAVRETKKKLIRNALERAGGNYTEAAKLLALHPNYLHRLIRNLGLKEALKK